MTNGTGAESSSIETQANDAVISCEARQREAGLRDAFHCHASIAANPTWPKVLLVRVQQQRRLGRGTRQVCLCNAALD